MGLEAAENLAKPLCEISKDRSDAETSSLERNVPLPCWRDQQGADYNPVVALMKKRKLPFKHLTNSASLEKTNRHCRCVRVRKQGREDKSQSALICSSLP